MQPIQNHLNEPRKTGLLGIVSTATKEPEIGKEKLEHGDTTGQPNWDSVGCEPKMPTNAMLDML